MGLTGLSSALAALVLAAEIMNPAAQPLCLLPGPSNWQPNSERFWPAAVVMQPMHGLKCI